MAVAQRKEGSRLGEIAVQKGYLDARELDRCLTHQEKLRDIGINIRLGQLMIRHDLISTSQLVELLDRQDEARHGPLD